MSAVEAMVDRVAVFVGRVAVVTAKAAVVREGAMKRVGRWSTKLRSVHSMQMFW